MIGKLYFNKAIFKRMGLGFEVTKEMASKPAQH
jgi:hypothetical protein